MTGEDRPQSIENEKEAKRRKIAHSGLLFSLYSSVRTVVVVLSTTVHPLCRFLHDVTKRRSRYDKRILRRDGSRTRRFAKVVCDEVTNSLTSLRFYSTCQCQTYTLQKRMQSGWIKGLVFVHIIDRRDNKKTTYYRKE